MARSFYVYARQGIYHAEIFDPVSRSRLTSRTTGKRSRDEAILVVGEWIKNGLPSPSGARRAVAEKATIESAFRSVTAKIWRAATRHAIFSPPSR